MFNPNFKPYMACVSNLVGEEMLFYHVEQQLGIAKGTTVYFMLITDFAMLVEAFKVYQQVISQNTHGAYQT